MEAEGDANSARESGDAHSGEFNAAYAPFLLFICIFFWGGGDKRV